MTRPARDMATDAGGSPRSVVPGPSLRGFGHVRRYRDPRLDRVAAKILPGEHYVTTADEVIVTVLGSCVSACIWDPGAGVGGMNHFMIPEARRVDDGGRPGSSDAGRYGMYAMELLINGVLKHGAERSRLLVKLAGGGHVIESTSRIGEMNIEFARRYLEAEGLAVMAEHVGGLHARRLVFHPLSGRTQVMELSTTAHGAVVRRERDYASTIRAERSGGVELFEES